MAVAVVALAMMLPACVSALDAVVSNPCSIGVTTSFFGGNAPPALSKFWTRRTEVPAESHVSVLSAFVDPDAPHVGWALVEIPGKQPQILRVDLSGGEPVPVLIPASYCA